jgi:enamine deaminase RidA (YjgF/YER057c/UK114 family)
MLCRQETKTLHLIRINLIIVRQRGWGGRRNHAAIYLDKEHNMTETKAVNPWAWQDQFGFSQAIEVKGGQRVVYCSGQTSVDASGNPMHGRDMVKQVSQSLDNLETVLKQAGLSLANVVRLNYYTTDMAAFMKAGPAFGPRLAANQLQHCSW